MFLCGFSILSPWPYWGAPFLWGSALLYTHREEYTTHLLSFSADLEFLPCQGTESYAWGHFVKLVLWQNEREKDRWARDLIVNGKGNFRKSTKIILISGDFIMWSISFIACSYPHHLSARAPDCDNNHSIGITLIRTKLHPSRLPVSLVRQLGENMLTLLLSHPAPHLFVCFTHPL